MTLSPHPQLLHMTGRPAIIIPSKVKGMLSFADATGSGTSLVVPDLLQAGVSATWSVAAQAPVISANATNGYAQATYDGANTNLLWPLTSIMNQTDAWGVAGWVYLNSTAGVQNIAAHIGTGHTNRTFVRLAPGGFDRLYGPTTVQNINPANNTASAWFWFRFSYVGALTGNARAEISYDGTLQSFTTTNVGGLDEIPSSLSTEASTSGKFVGIGSDSAGTVGLLNGRFGSYVFFLHDSAAHLTAAEEAALMAINSFAGAV